MRPDDTFQFLHQLPVRCGSRAPAGTQRGLPEGVPAAWADRRDLRVTAREARGDPSSRCPRETNHCVFPQPPSPIPPLHTFAQSLSRRSAPTAWTSSRETKGKRANRTPASTTPSRLPDTDFLSRVRTQGHRAPGGLLTRAGPPRPRGDVSPPTVDL